MINSLLILRVFCLIPPFYHFRKLKSENISSEIEMNARVKINLLYELWKREEKYEQVTENIHNIPIIRHKLMQM